MFCFWLEALGFRLFVRKVANFMRDELILIVISYALIFALIFEMEYVRGSLFFRNVSSKICEEKRIFRVEYVE